MFAAGFRISQAVSFLFARSSALLCMATVILFGNTVLAQKDFGDLGLPTVTNEMPPFAGISSGPGVQYQATFKVEQDSNRGQIIVTADIAPGHHTYSTTQPSGGPTRTTIELKDDFVKVTGPFVPDRDPEIGFDEESWPGLPIEEYYDQISWTAEIEFTKELEFENTELQLEVDGLVCEESCMPVGGKYKAEFAGFYGEQPKATSLRVEATHAVWNAKLSPATVTPGGIAIISVTAKNDTGYHVYEFVPGDEETTFRTLIVGKTKSGLKFGTPTTDAAAEPYPGFEEVSYHNGTVTWQIPVYVPDSAIQGEFPLEVLVGFGTCNDRGCDEPKGLAINGTLTVGGKTEKTSADLLLAAMSFNDVADSPMLASWIDGDTVDQLAQSAVAPEKGERADQPKQSLTAFHLLAALVGGFILNFMPCVLPVIGLKVMSFASQAGNSHSRIVALNLAYVAGILAVMLVLAWITIAAKALSGNAFGWGEQFTHLEFKVALAALVFAMALSFLGVWEIPIPGFATTTKSGELMQKEGLTGAFLKGVLTTILATPCSGPLLGSLFGLSLVLSATSVLILYTAVGIGLAFPFFALCIWPGSIKMLPKPGPWMETLKQALAFPLLLTVVFFVSSIGSDHRIATLILLIVVWFACWLIGKVPAYSDKSTIWKTWGAAIATIAVGAFVSFSFFGPFKSDLPWVPYSETQLAKYRQEGKTVMLDFTANWCLTCQVNTRVAIDKVRVAQLVEENQVVPMLADWTDKSDAIRNKLEELQSNSIPLLVIYPPDPDAEPILLRDSLTESQVLNALEEAGPSRIKTKLTSSQVD